MSIDSKVRKAIKKIQNMSADEFEKELTKH